HGAARFLGALRRNNRKQWFEEHRSDYEEQLLEPAKEFVIDLGAKLRTLRPKLQVDPRTNYGVKRINRDIRFARDKKPYKDHQTLWWWEGREAGCARLLVQPHANSRAACRRAVPGRAQAP